MVPSDTDISFFTFLKCNYHSVEFTTFLHYIEASFFKHKGQSPLLCFCRNRSNFNGFCTKLSGLKRTSFRNGCLTKIKSDFEDYSAT